MAINSVFASLDAELAEAIANLSPDTQRMLAATVAERTLDYAGQDPSELRIAVAAGAFGDTAVRKKLRERATAADVAARNSMAIEADDWKELRRTARALTAAVDALDPDPARAAQRVAYQVWFAYPKGEAVAMIRELLEARRVLPSS